MTPEEYLRARGWIDAWTQSLERNDSRWTHRERGDAALTLAEAVEIQLAEDRARLAFVLDQSAVTILWPDRRLPDGFVTAYAGAQFLIGPKGPEGPPQSPPLSEWAENNGRWVRDWTRGPKAAQVAVAVTFDQKRGLWTGDNLAFFKRAGDARNHVDATLRKQGVL